MRSGRVHQTKWLIAFEGVDGRNAAEKLRGATLKAEPLDSEDIEQDESVIFIHELIGRRLIDQFGADHGTVASVIDNPASDLLELEDGRLVPLTFYQSHDEHTVTVDVPIGLLDDADSLDAR